MIPHCFASFVSSVTLYWLEHRPISISYPWQLTWRQKASHLFLLPVHHYNDRQYIKRQTNDDIELTIIANDWWQWFHFSLIIIDRFRKIIPWIEMLHLERNDFRIRRNSNEAHCALSIKSHLQSRCSFKWPTKLMQKNFIGINLTCQHIVCS